MSDTASQQGQQGDERAPQVLRQMVVKLVQQSDQIQHGQQHQLEGMLEEVRDAIAIASGQTEQQLQRQRHQIVAQAQGSSQLSDQAQQWASEALNALDNHDAQANRQFQQVCAAQIPQLAKASAQAGLEAPAEARQYARTQGRHGGQEDRPSGSQY